VRNDWENITVHIGGRDVTNLPLEKCPPILKKGQYKVLWPNGNEETLEVVMRKYYETVHDMGHEYPVSGEKPYFRFFFNGAKQEVYAPNLGVKVWKDE
jgi:hypothetical protein